MPNGPKLNVRDTDILIPLSQAALDVLEWFGAWTPKVHRATDKTWEHRRAWPPGFRQFADLSVQGYRDGVRAAREMAAPPHPKEVWGIIQSQLLPYRLLEGTLSLSRLTQRGRAALLLNGRPCPEEFDSHCHDIFDKVDLLPIIRRDMYSSRRMDLTSGMSLPDTENTWRWLLVEYNAESYEGRYTLNCASARLTQPSGERALNGSLRTHSRYISIHVQNAEGRAICDFAFSSEQLADLLTSNSTVPVTIDNYYGTDGMRYSEPAPQPMDAMRRMQYRLRNAEDTQADLLEGLLKTVREAESKGRMGKGALAALAHSLSVALTNGDANRGFVVREAQEEISAVVESAWSVLAERVELSEGTGVVGLLGSSQGKDRVLALLGVSDAAVDAEVDDEVDERDHARDFFGDRGGYS